MLQEKSGSAAPTKTGGTSEVDGAKITELTRLTDELRAANEKLQADNQRLTAARYVSSKINS